MTILLQPSDLASQQNLRNMFARARQVFVRTHDQYMQQQHQQRARHSPFGSATIGANGFPFHHGGNGHGHHGSRPGSRGGLGAGGRVTPSALNNANVVNSNMVINPGMKLKMQKCVFLRLKMQ